MSLLGKVFAFLNLLGVAGVLVMGMLTFNKKMAWANAGAQQMLRLEGLPLDDQDTDKLGYSKKDNLNEANVRAVISGQVVLTQVDEVKRVHTIVEGKLDEIKSAPDKLLALARLLKPFTLDYSRYVELVQIERNLGLPGEDEKTANVRRVALKTQLSQAAIEADALVKKQPVAKDSDEPRKEKRDFNQAFTEFTNIQRARPRDPFVRAYLTARAMALAATKPADFETTYLAAMDLLLNESLAELDAVYKAAATGDFVSKIPDEAKSPRASASIQRYFIVRYLFNIAPFADPEGMTAAGWSSPAIERVVGVVGLEMFPMAILEQSARIGALTNALKTESNLPNTYADEIIKQLNLERSQFVAQHNKLIDYLIEVKAIVEERRERFGKIKKVYDEHQLLADSSKKLNDDLNEMLDTSRGDVARELKTIRELARSLLAVRLQGRDAAEINQKLEQEIRRLERLYR